MFAALVVRADADDDLNWTVSVDSTIVRAHQHAAGARAEGPRQANRTTMPPAGPAADCSAERKSGWRWTPRPRV
ncbi:hypothetical protein [Streptomyces sp. NPDC058701]|uniref:hypothetical protein n=1 Tax=Streptomyces sp. NPDC058701 TaxID=3346608 RepID=UPI00364FE2B5